MSAFWQFSLDFYARPQVADACLALQDSADVDVNVLLYLLFLAAHKRQIVRDDVARIDTIAAEWRAHAVLPLRTLRRKLKTGITPLPAADTDPLRSAVKRLELDAERIEQEALERLAPARTIGAAAASARAAARSNLAAYADFLLALPLSPVDTLLESFAQLHA